MEAMIKRYLVGFLILFVMTGCGTTVKQTLSPTTAKPVTGEYRRVVVLPFADYTPSPSAYEYLQRNSMILEAFHDEFYRIGFVPAVEEDVVRYLIDKGVIMTDPEASPFADIFKEELRGDWCPQIKEELAKEFYRSFTGGKSQHYGRKSELISLDTPVIKKLGKIFDADYIVRGRILEFRAAEEDTFNPLKTGILPFFFKAGARSIFGVARSEDYELYHKMAVGGLFGALIADENTPIDDDEDLKLSGSPTFGTVSYSKDEYTGVNRMIWGMAGAGLAYLAQKGGKVPDATVQIRVIVQDAKTGMVVWSNRAETRVTPESTYSEQDGLMLFKEAINHTAKSLVENFKLCLASGTLAIPAVSEQEKKLTEVQSVEDKTAETEAKRAADMANQFAREAKQAAEHAREAASRACSAEQGAKNASLESKKIQEKIDAK